MVSSPNLLPSTHVVRDNHTISIKDLPLLFKRKSFCCFETVSHGTPKSTENQKFSEECRIVSDTDTLYSQGCQNFTSLYRLVVSAPEGQRWFEKQVGILMQIKYHKPEESLKKLKIQQSVCFWPSQKAFLTKVD